ncbi:MAG: glycoside hydrolase family 3 N-terminal domain-containing protein, partial [Solirubrobacteraceae bacterium]
QLRRDVGFRGVTISDDLAAPAFAAHGGAAGAGVQAARAGVDLLLYAGTYEGADGAARALETEIRARRMDRAALERGAARVLALRGRLR